MENQVIEYKNIQKIRSGDKGFADLAKTCVCLANLHGGTIVIGFDDRTHKPEPGQKINPGEINTTLVRLRSLCFNVGLSASDILIDKSGDEYFEIHVLQSMKSISTTSDGKIFIRVGDQCQPVRGEDVHRLVAEKEGFQWELVVHKTVGLNDIRDTEIAKFVRDIRISPKVKETVKIKSDIEILEHYNLSDSGFLTNLGILFLGTSKQRARLSYPLTLQYIVYDSNDIKVRKETWNDYQLNPKELIFELENKAIELTYYHEFPRGMIRDAVRLYPEKVVRELIINAIAHKSYTISGDIFIEVHADRLEITSPGGLPLGITKDNILHQRQRRNPHLINVLHDLNLMEGEGSGYDMIYEINSKLGKQFPVVQNDFNYTKVIQDAKITDNESFALISFITEYYPLKQREIIALGIIVRRRKILSTQLAKELQLPEEDRLRNWVQGLLNHQIVITRGNKKSTEYIVNPKLITQAKINVKPSLITIENHRLKALIEEDILIHPMSSAADVQSHLVDIPLKEIRKCIYKMVQEGVLDHTSSKTYRRYFLAKKNRKKIETEKKSG
jgi:ATP-dependent DNA helicase RecG